MKITKCLLNLLAAQTIIAIFSLYSYALEKPTHFEINQYVARHKIGGFSLDEYLKEQLGFQEGIEEILVQPKNTIIKGKPPTIYRWLAFGGEKEDEPTLRSFRHYHNPLETWNKAGLKGGIQIPFIGRCVSLIIWAQSRDQPHGRYSWQDVRDYFYSALTSEDQATRESYFAETFRGLGQQMHLVEDASVPLHTRDDIHVLYNYEDFVGDIQANKDPEIRQRFYTDWLSDSERYGYDKSVLNLIPNPSAPISIAGIIDTDKYTGENAEVTISEPVGIAEYSNANFFSRDTVFRDFPYPTHASVEIQDTEINDRRDPSRRVLRKYYVKVADGDTGYRLATVPLLERYGVECVPFCAELLYKMATLDSEVYGDYAERLIPQAVGYSAGLLNYFFRGKLEVEFVDGDLKVTNKSNETMHDGVFELYYDNEDGHRREIVTDSGAEVTELQPDGDQTIMFDLPWDAESYILVYTGSLGNELGAVVGKVFQPFKPKGCFSILYGDIQHLECYVFDPETREVTLETAPELSWPARDLCDYLAFSRGGVQLSAFDASGAIWLFRPSCVTATGYGDLVMDPNIRVYDRQEHLATGNLIIKRTDEEFLLKYRTRPPEKYVWHEEDGGYFTYEGQASDPYLCWPARRLYECGRSYDLNVQNEIVLPYKADTWADCDIVDGTPVEGYRFFYHRGGWGPYFKPATGRMQDGDVLSVTLIKSDDFSCDEKMEGSCVITDVGFHGCCYGDLDCIVGENVNCTERRYCYMGQCYYPTYECSYRCDGKAEGYGQDFDYEVKIYGDEVSRVGYMSKYHYDVDYTGYYLYVDYNFEGPGCEGWAFNACKNGVAGHVLSRCSVDNYVAFEPNVPIYFSFDGKTTTAEGCELEGAIPDEGEHDGMLYMSDGETVVISEPVKVVVEHERQAPYFSAWVKDYGSNNNYIQAVWSSVDDGINNQCFIFINNSNTGKKYFGINETDVTAKVVAGLEGCIEGDFSWDNVRGIVSRFNPVEE